MCILIVCVQGDVAVGTSAGEIKLYTNPAKNGWHQAKTNITQLVRKSKFCNMHSLAHTQVHMHMRMPSTVKMNTAI